MLVLKAIFSFDWALWFQWVMATTLGWFLGSVLFGGLSFLLAGVGVGFLQWYVLQHRIYQPFRWVLATAAGWTAGYFAVLLAVPQELELFNGIVLGVSTGAAQWLLLRHEVSWAGWWIVFSAIAWTTGLGLLPGLTMTGLMSGTITGALLEVLLRFPKPPSARDENHLDRTAHHGRR